MNIIRSVIFLLFLATPAVCLAGPSEEAEAALKRNGDNVVTELVDIGRVSPEAAAAVMVATAQNRPVLLRATMDALAGVMTANAYGQAVSLASRALSGQPELRHLVASIAREILLPDSRRGPGRGRGDAPPGRVGEDPPEPDEPASPS